MMLLADSFTDTCIATEEDAANVKTEVADEDDGAITT